MIEWEEVQYDDENLVRAFVSYRGVYCLCEPSKANEGKYDASATTSEGNWQSEQYRLVHILDTYAEPSFQGYDSLEQAQFACTAFVDLYFEGKIEPTYTERTRSKSKSKSKKKSKRKK